MPNMLEQLASLLAYGGPPSVTTGPNAQDRQPAITPGAAMLAQLQQALGNRPELSGVPKRNEDVPTLGGGTTHGLPTGRSQQGSGSGISDFLQNLLGGRNPVYERSVRDTATWLQGEGMDAGTANVFARDPDLLRKYAVDRWNNHQQSSRPDWEMTSVYDQGGNEQKGRWDKNSGDFVPMGGSKSSILSPEEEQQKIRLAQAGRAQTNVNVGTGEGKYDQTLGEGYAKRFLETQQMTSNAGKGLNTIAVMRQAMKQPGFYSGMVRMLSSTASACCLR